MQYVCDIAWLMLTRLARSKHGGGFEESHIAAITCIDNVTEKRQTGYLHAEKFPESLTLRRLYQHHAIATAFAGMK